MRLTTDLLCFDIAMLQVQWVPSWYADEARSGCHDRLVFHDVRQENTSAHATTPETSTATSNAVISER
jgi:hypothetical protein